MGADLVHRIRPPDDAGRRDEHVIWLGPDRGSDTGDDLFGVGEALGAGGDVRVLRDDDVRRGAARRRRSNG